MRNSIVLIGLLLLFSSAHALDNLFVVCNEFWLHVRVRRVPIFDQLSVQHYELYLGNGCSVTRILPDFFEFTYLHSSCGITKHDHMWGIFIESSVSYEPVILNFRGYVPISCSVHRKFRFFFTRREVDTTGYSFGVTTQGPLGRANSTLSQVENSGTQPGTTLGNSFSHAGLLNSSSDLSEIIKP